jgi:hypothetical protein
MNAATQEMQEEYQNQDEEVTRRTKSCASLFYYYNISSMQLYPSTIDLLSPHLLSC